MTQDEWKNMTRDEFRAYLGYKFDEKPWTVSHEELYNIGQKLGTLRIHATSMHHDNRPYDDIGMEIENVINMLQAIFDRNLGKAT